MEHSPRSGLELAPESKALPGNRVDTGTRPVHLLRFRNMREIAIGLRCLRFFDCNLVPRHSHHGENAKNHHHDGEFDEREAG